jgi:hypothetical protein
MVVSIKNARFKCQPSTPMQSFVSIRRHLFMEIDDKGGEIGTKIYKCIMGRSKCIMGEVEGGHRQRGSNIEE